MHSNHLPVISCVCLLSVLYSISHAVESDKGLCDLDIDTHTSRINCSKRNLDAIPKVWPKNMEDIKSAARVRITFASNNLTSVSLLPALPGSHMVAISLNNNSITHIEYNAFANIPNVYYLDFSYNNLTAEALRSEVFQGPYVNGRYGDLLVATLDFKYNDIHSLDRYLFQHTPNLTRLYLSNNPIRILDHVTVLALESAVNLQILELANTGLETIPLETFKTMNNLQQLDLSGNKFVTVPESLTLIGASLEYLAFNNNPIVELNDDSFIGLTNLKQLELQENSFLMEVKSSTFSQLTSLQSLFLCHNRNLKYISHNAFRGLKDKWTLKEIFLDENNLSELPSDLMPWNMLTVLGMTGNNWLCNCNMVNIINKQGAASKFGHDKIPYCMAPMEWSGLPVTKVILEYCPTFNTTNSKNEGRFKFTTFRPKHILWSIFGVAVVVFIGILLGYLTKGAKKIYNKHIKPEPIRYVNIHSPDASFA